MNYSHIKVFFTVAKHKNISKAAEELGVSQPAVSRIISTLETDYAVKLFVRTKNGVDLSHEGSILYESIKGPMFELEKITKIAAEPNFFHKVVVHIGATTMALSCFLFKHLEYLKSSYPDITFRIYTGSSSQLVKMLNERKIDLAFVSTPYKGIEKLEVHDVYELKNVLIAPYTYKKKIKSPTSIKDLVNYPFILLNNEMQYREQLENYFDRLGIKINPAYEPDSSSILLQFVENDLGLTFIPEEMATDSIQKKKVFKVKLFEELPKRFISFALNKESTKSKFINEIKLSILSQITEK